MRTQKWHVLDHFLDTLEKLGGIRFAHAGFYEADHKTFKQNYRGSSQRRILATDEAVRREHCFFEHQHRFLKRGFYCSRVSFSLSKAAEEDGA